MTELHDETTCWRCGAPADPGCAERHRRLAPSSEYRSSLGFPVERGDPGRFGHDAVYVTISYCRRCRNIASRSVVGAALALGVAVILPFLTGRHWVLSLVVLSLCAIFIERAFRQRNRRRRDVDHPGLKRLADAGWRPRVLD